MWRIEQLSSNSAAPNPTEPESSKGDQGLPPRKPRNSGPKGHGGKRTKSGCLTCRKRRIKCGEERPTCQNCIKSKRQCAGYDQKVIFKDPLNTYRPPKSTLSRPSISFATPFVGEPPLSQGNPKPQALLAQTPNYIISNPPIPVRDSRQTVRATLTSSSPLVSPVREPRAYTFLGGNHNGPPNNQQPSSRRESAYNVERDIIDQPRLPEPIQFRAPREQATHYDFNALVKTEAGREPSYLPAPMPSLNWSTGPSPAYLQSYSAITWTTADTQSPMEDMHTSQRQRESGGIVGALDSFEESERDQSTRYQGTSANIVAYTPRTASLDITFPDSSTVARQYNSKAEKEYHFHESDDDADLEEYNNEPWHSDMQHDVDHLESNDLGIVVAFQATQDYQANNYRPFTSFADQSNILATYVPSSQATPMQDPVTAMIFCHFVNATGPSMSVFERHPANPSLMFEGVPVPRSQQHIWAYTFPTLALQNPALLHAMLALASFHIAKLYGGPITASLKHYAIGLRRVAKLVSSPIRRSHPATLAAAMLLAFYEVWSADHQKWSNHLLGAKQLIREIDFVSMAGHVKRKKAQQRRGELETRNRGQWNNNTSANNHGEQYPPLDLDEADEILISKLMGRNAHNQHRPSTDMPSQPTWNSHYSQGDVETYETQRDLFWWYCKQDVYQAILGASKLFMDYSYWSHCPPRAPLGRLNAVYGSFDHLMLLMGRLSDFAARDLKRKRLAMKANNGWRPPPWLFPQGPPTAPSPQTPTAMPPFSGMVPGVTEARLPMGFEDTPNSSPRSTAGGESDLHTQTSEAEGEWQEIRTAFTIIADHFGEDFQPLGPEYVAEIQTPFGPASQYRTYTIAGLWMNYYMGLIACYRCHPSMPPASMVAAGVMRSKTAEYANKLGQIAAGIAPDCHVSASVAPGVGAVLIESSTCLFVSAIQYTDATQRHWTIDRLHHIARLTGWQTALAISGGCEASWTKTFEAGKGPPYTRAPDLASNAFSHGSPEKVGARRDTQKLKRRIDAAFVGKSAEERREVLEKPDRVHYALGVLGLEEDFAGLDVGG